MLLAFVLECTQCSLHAHVCVCVWGGSGVFLLCSMDSIGLAFFGNLLRHDCLWTAKEERFGNTFSQGLRFQGYRSWDEQLKA